ncbi:MAG: hypothetical protein AAF385_15750 [Pseudomonadota bacterium]
MATQAQATKMRLFRIALLVTGLFVCDAHAEPPHLLRQPTFNARSLAEAVNYFVGKGETESLAELKLLADPNWDLQKGYDINERIGWLARILYIPKNDNSPIRSPMFGGLALPYKSMPPATWPLYPVVRQDDVYLVLSEGNILAGRPELATDYLDFCEKHGTFREKTIAVPTTQQVRQAVTSLKQSNRWKTIEWRDSGTHWSYQYTPSVIVEFLLRQSENKNANTGV